MAICDLCNTPVGPDSKRYSASQVKTAVRAGLRPPTTAFEFGAAFGMSQAQAEESWVQRVMVDTTDWLFCPSCTSRIEQYLGRSQAKREPSQVKKVMEEASTISPVLDSELSLADLVMLGQVDHGKTTLTSAITKALSSKGLADYVPVDRIEKAAEESGRGSSIAMARIEFKTQKCHYGIVDFPRHADIIRGLTTGAVQPGGAILVVAVTDEPPMPQTREQLLVAQHMEMPYIVVFLNKVDLVDDEDLLELAELELQLLLDECGFPGDDIPIIHGSAMKALESDGVGPDAASIMELLDALDAVTSLDKIGAAQTMQAAVPLESDSDQEMLDVLRQLCDAYVVNDRAAITRLEPLATQIGKDLNRRGGLKEMRRVFAQLGGRRGSRTLEMHWGGIGDWQA
jgi:signal recognition particle receptor subunit beta